MAQVPGYAEPHHAGWSPEPPRRRRRTGLVAGIVVLALLLVSGGAAWLGLALDARLPERVPASAVDSPRTLAAVQLVTGHCIDRLPEDGQVTRVRVVPCEVEHEAQVWSQYAFAEQAVWPGQADADAQVSAACQLPAVLEQEGVRLVTWAPTAASWRRGDRTGLCVAVLPSPSTESLFAPGTLG
mgnify:CR=1 FL=1